MTNKQAYAGLLERLVARRGLFAAAEKMASIMGCRFTLNELGKQKAEEARGQGELINPDGPEAAEAISSLLKRVDRLETAARNARAWVFECWGWLMETDLDMKCPMEVDPLDIVEQFDALLGIDAALNSDAPLSTPDNKDKPNA